MDVEPRVSMWFSEYISSVMLLSHINVWDSDLFEIDTEVKNFTIQ